MKEKTSYLSEEVCRSCDVENVRESMHQSFTDTRKEKTIGNLEPLCSLRTIKLLTKLGVSHGFHVKLYPGHRLCLQNFSLNNFGCKYSPGYNKICPDISLICLVVIT